MRASLVDRLGSATLADTGFPQQPEIHRRVQEHTGRAPPSEDRSLTEFHCADGVFCTGAMGELAGVTRIDGRTIGDSQIGSLTERLLGL